SQGAMPANIPSHTPPSPVTWRSTGIPRRTPIPLALAPRQDGLPPGRSSPRRRQPDSRSPGLFDLRTGVHLPPGAPAGPNIRESLSLVGAGAAPDDADPRPSPDPPFAGTRL